MLLTIIPGNHGNIVGCQLDVVNLEKRPWYEALSYVWGPATPSQIICNSRLFEVTPKFKSCSSTNTKPTARTS